VKRFSPYFYAGENDLTHNNYRKFHPSKSFSLKTAKKQVILGVSAYQGQTSASLVCHTGEVLAESRHSSEKMAVWENMPNHCEEWQREKVPLVVEEVLAHPRAPKPSELYGIAVPLGPGMIPVTKIGIDFSLALGNKFNVPVIPINMIEA
jgi:tRNA A37 threonylcarbamoyltransferase TsaD